ncbi:MAG: HEAT repeat domain-containing protein [Desulfobacterales bacterium]
MTEHAVDNHRCRTATHRAGIKAAPAAAALAAGMAVAQIISTLHVYLSNDRLYRNMRMIADAGYLTVPNADTLALLNEVSSAFWGGLFFTVTVGAFLSLLSFLCACVMIHVVKRRKWVSVLGGIVWVLVLMFVVLQGGTGMAAAYFMFVPPAVFMVSLISVPRRPVRKAAVVALCHTTAILVLAIAWTAQLDRRMFIDFRDGMLLSNPVGEKITAYYYRYTLYPAAVFASPEQKMIKTVVIDGNMTANLRHRMENTCIALDYLPLKDVPEVDLALRVEGERLFFQNRGSPILETTVAAFQASPHTYLKAYSKAVDTYAFFRRFALVSLLIGFPIVFYIMLYTTVRLVFFRIIGDLPSVLTAVLICFLTGLSLLMMFHMNRSGRYDVSDIHDLMGSCDHMDRVNGWKMLYQNNLEPDKIPNYRVDLHHPSVPVRYWMAKALGRSKSRHTLDDLIMLADDPHPNVACQAFDALGKRGNRAFIPLLLKKLADSRHWYVQVYVYRALRELGWKQKLSTSAFS